jgi:hypothetical protein
MRKKIVFIMTLTMSLGLVACGSSTSSTNETSSTPTAEAVVAESAAGEGAEVDVGGPYPASTAWDEYSISDYHFDETDEDVTMTIQTNTAHDTFDMQFDFFGDKQQITFHSDETVDYDLSGFMTKDVKNLVVFVSEITDWAPIE